MKYQRDYSRHFPATKDRSTRVRKAIKVLCVLEDYLGRGLDGLACLDMGCSIGLITEHLARESELAVGVDIDEWALREGQRSLGSRARFVVADIGSVPFPAGTFDVIACSQVYEHVPDVNLLVAEIHRVLKKGGVCFFSGPNRWAIVERHYHLPFLSWLPRRWADLYVRLTGRGKAYHERPRSAGELARLLWRFTIHDYTLQLLSTPSCYALDEEVGIFRYVPEWIWRFLYYLMPNFNWILVKDGD